MPHRYSHVDEKEERTAVAAALALVLDAKGGIPGGTCTNSNATTIPPKTENPAVAGLSLRGATQI